MLLPRAATLEALEKRWPLTVVTRLPGYVKPPADAALPISIVNGVARVGGGGGGDAGGGSADSGGRFPGVGRQVMPTTERGAALYEDAPPADKKSTAAK